KSGIRDVRVEPSIECLKVKANNCNGGVLGVEKRCDRDLVLDDVIVSANSYKLIEFVRDNKGNIIIFEPKGNFDSYTPVNRDTLSVGAELGEQSITITYTKENVCGGVKSLFFRYPGEESALYYILDIVGYKCVGCGYDISIIGYISLGGTVVEVEPTLVFNTGYGPETKCFEEYEGGNERRRRNLSGVGFAYNEFILTKHEVEDLRVCLTEAKSSGYCESVVHCFYPGWDGDNTECANNKCVY
ncbi:MAG: hypothetical protein KAU03_05065, partial [Candidatus Altiarchaeales archaeon]|nr:hypothetical protein [Candidatus Altiarchaeales archaeon]